MVDDGRDDGGCGWLLAGFTASAASAGGPTGTARRVRRVVAMRAAELKTMLLFYANGSVLDKVIALLLLLWVCGLRSGRPVAKIVETVQSLVASGSGCDAEERRGVN